MPTGLVRLLVCLGALSAVTAPRVAVADDSDLHWLVEGYYRTRGVALTNLAPEPRTTIPNPLTGDSIVLPDVRNTSYMTQRLRLSPSLALGTKAKLLFEVNALDDVLLGDNNAISSAPLFAVNGSNQYFLGGPERRSVDVTRAWIEYEVPVGFMTVGRMPSHWGLGLVSNGGGSANWDPLSPAGKPRRKHYDTYFDDDFGDNHFGSTQDRILFATAPLTVVKTLQGKTDVSSKLFVAYAFDKISEAPLYTAEADRRARPFGQEGFLSRGAKDDDVNEHVFVLLYDDPDWDKIRWSDELHVGTQWVIRTQKEAFSEPSAAPPGAKDEGSFVWIGDLWYRIRYGSFYSEAEAFHVGGETTGGFGFPFANQKNTADIDGAVARAGYLSDRVDAIAEVGYSSGDDNLSDEKIKQLPLHPDHHVGLILFPEIVRERAARVFGPRFISQAFPDGAKDLASLGGVMNARYLQPKVRWRPGIAGLEVVGAVLFAWVDEWSQPPNVFVEPATPGASKYLGTEVDVAVKSRFADEHLDVSLEAGYLRFGDVLKTLSDGSGEPIPGAPVGAASVQARIAYLF